MAESDRDKQYELSERELVILRAVVQNYILMANPVGSRFLSKVLERDLNVSAATIRNVMADLEDLGFITHPHTSAGRIPTDKGYRLYVDTLMLGNILSEQERRQLEQGLLAVNEDRVLRSVSRLLGVFTSYLSVVQMPVFRDVAVERVDVFYLSTSRLLVVITLASSTVRTMTLELNTEIDPADVEHVRRVLNERLAGKTLDVLRAHAASLLSDIGENKHDSLFRVFVESAASLFSSEMVPGDRYHISGAKDLLQHPEFVSADSFRTVIEMIEDEEIIIHLLDVATQAGKVDAKKMNDVRVFIGSEIKNSLMEEYSLLSTRYSFNAGHGTIALIGPKRMNYARMIAILQHVSSLITTKFD